VKLFAKSNSLKWKKFLFWSFVVVVVDAVAVVDVVVATVATHSWPVDAVAWRDLVHFSGIGWSSCFVVDFLRALIKMWAYRLSGLGLRLKADNILLKEKIAISKSLLKTR
jgi:hypothetical protein